MKPETKCWNIRPGVVFWIRYPYVFPEDCPDAFPEKEVKEEDGAVDQLPVLVLDRFASDPEPVDAFGAFGKRRKVRCRLGKA